MKYLLSLIINSMLLVYGSEVQDFNIINKQNEITIQEGKSILHNLLSRSSTEQKTILTPREEKNINLIFYNMVSMGVNLLLFVFRQLIILYGFILIVVLVVNSHFYGTLYAYILAVIGTISLLILLFIHANYTNGPTYNTKFSNGVTPNLMIIIYLLINTYFILSALKYSYNNWYKHHRSTDVKQDLYY